MIGLSLEMQRREKRGGRGKFSGRGKGGEVVSTSTSTKRRLGELKGREKKRGEGTLKGKGGEAVG